MLADALIEGGAKPGEVAGVGDNDEHAASGGQGQFGGLEQQRRPVPGPVGHRREHRARRSSGPQRLRVVSPAVVLREQGGGRFDGPVRRGFLRRGFAGGVFLGLDPGHAGRDGRAQHVPDPAGIAFGHGAGHCKHRGGEDNLRGHHGSQRLQLDPGIGVLEPFGEETRQFLPAKANLDPDPGLRRLVELGRHQVVEGPVQVRDGGIDHDPGDGQFLGHVGDAGQRGRQVKARQQRWLGRALHAPHLPFHAMRITLLPASGQP